MSGDITWPCPRCHQQIRVDSTYRGGKVRCPHCREVIGTAPSESIRVAPPVALPAPPSPRRDPAPKRGQTIASLSMWFGVLSLALCGFGLGPVAIVLGIIAIAKGEHAGRQGEAVAGILLGLLGIFVHAAAAVFFMSQPAQPSKPAVPPGWEIINQ